MNTSVKIKYPIALKLILIISVIVVFSLGGLTYLVSYFTAADVRVTAEENNHTVNSRSAAVAQEMILSMRSNAFLLLDMQESGNSSGDAVLSFFARNQNIAAILVPGGTELINKNYFTVNELQQSLVSDFMAVHSDDVNRAVKGETLALNAAPVFALPVLVCMFPRGEKGNRTAAVIFFSAESITESFGTGSTSQSFMINDKNDLLVHSDFELVKSGANMSAMPLVKQMRANNDENRQILFKNTDGKEYFGAYQKLPVGDIGVLTIVRKSVVLETVTDTMYRNMWLSIAVVALAVLFIGLYSKKMSRPLRTLTDAADEIKQGNFDVNLKPRTQDEIGVLTQSFVDMGHGLAERERLKETFGRFTNKDIAERAARGELSLGGEAKTVTIFFSDIRSFTAMSEKLQPSEVVEFLNDYMTRMVDCVNATGGTVDKYIGDSIMAEWGAPQTSGDPAQDALNAVKTALRMRATLYLYNKARAAEHKPPVRIGCGINTGPVIAGQIGSKSRMEYTCIGDAVNFASRTESLNKPLHTDILITEDTYNLVRDAVLVEEMPTVTVKGKEKPQHMYAVINIPGATDVPGAGVRGPRTIAQVRAIIGTTAPDLTGVDLDEDEKKYKIQGK